LTIAVFVGLGVAFLLMLAMAVLAVHGFAKSRREMGWRTRAYNIFTGKWSDENNEGPE